MIGIIILLFLILWIPSVVVTTGIILASFRHKSYESYRADLGMAIFISMFACAALGPVGIVVALLFTGFAEHGFQLKPDND